MNIQLRRSKNSSLPPEYSDKSHTKNPLKIISTPAVSEFASRDTKKTSVPATVSTPSRPRRMSITSRLQEDGFNKPEDIEDAKTKTAVGFTVREATELESTTGSFRIKRNKRADRPTSATGVKLKETMTPGMDLDKGLPKGFNHYLNQKAVEKARQMSATLKVQKKEDDLRQAFRQKFEDKEKKRMVVLSNLLAKKQVKMKNMEEEKRGISERLAQQKMDFMQSTAERKQNLFLKLENSERKKKEVDALKSQRLSARNNYVFERQQSLIEKKDQYGMFMMSTLSEIEDKFNQTTDRKRLLMEERVNKSLRHSLEVEERNRRANKDKNSLQKKFLQRIVGKMVKIRSKSVVPKLVALQDGQESVQENDSISKLEATNRRRKEEELDRIKKYNEKQKMLTDRMERKKVELREYVIEKKDQWDQRMTNIQKNLDVVSQGMDRKLEERMALHRERVDYIKAVKRERKKQLDSLDKSSDFGSRLTASAQFEFY